MMPWYAEEELDPITVEVVRHKLDGIANEMQSTLLRSSFSPIVKEGLDASASLFSRAGVPSRRRCDPHPPRHPDSGGGRGAAHLPGRRMREGDTFIVNDPYARRHAPAGHRGGDARIPPRPPIAMSGAMTHHQDVGGMTPARSHQRHRDLPGGAAHTAAQAARCRRLQRHAGQHDPAQRAHTRTR